VLGARGYAVEMFRDARRILVTTTPQPRLTLTRRWRPGVYRWLVWTVDGSGVRSAKPVVQAALDVTGR
jgi:hypothetical protein